MADRIFEIFDINHDGCLNFDEFAAIMDVLINGDEDERIQFSFALMDVNKSGFLDFREFFTHITKVVEHWSSMINSHVRVDKGEMKEVFNKMDRDRDGKISYKEY